MQLQAGLVKIGIGVSLLASLCLQAQAAMFKEDDSLICSVYLDMAVEDLMPTGGMSTAIAEKNWVGSYMRLAAMSFMHDIPAKEVARRYAVARKAERQSMTINGQPASSLIYSDRSLDYSRLLVAKTQQYCMHSKADLDVLNNMPQEKALSKIGEIKVELDAIGEKILKNVLR